MCRYMSLPRTFTEIINHLTARLDLTHFLHTSPADVEINYLLAGHLNAPSLEMIRHK